MTLKQLPVAEMIDEAIGESTLLKKAGTEVKVSLHKAILAAGKPGRWLADILHGKWLGHPLHPILTDVTIGAWLSGVTLDLVGKMTRRRKMHDAADTLIELGTISALPTALAGLTDYSAIKQDAVEYGAAHALLNSLALGLFTLSIRARRTNQRNSGIALSIAGLGLSMLSAWLGGHMIYTKRVGVNHAPTNIQPETWTAVYPADALLESAPQRIDVDGNAILLYRQGGTVYAIGAVCAHAGGPLDEGTFEGSCVTCPWHQSVYDLHDGSVVHGPSTFSQPAYEVRLNGGQIEIRAAHA